MPEFTQLSAFLIPNLEPTPMDQHQQKLRQAAARAFVKSLDQLQEALSADSQNPQAVIGSVDNNQAPSAAHEPAQFDLDSFEQAVADIEQFMAKQQEGKDLE